MPNVSRHHPLLKRHIQELGTNLLEKLHFQAVILLLGTYSG